MYHLAQVCIGRMLAPAGDPLMAGFVVKLDEVNALADNSPGFVWHFPPLSGNATALHPMAPDRASAMTGTIANPACCSIID